MTSGFAFTFATAKEDQRATRLTVEGEEILAIWAPYEMWGKGKVIHQRVYKEAYVIATIDGIAYTGYNIVDLHIITNLDTYEFVVTGKLTGYAEWKELVGAFCGPVVGKGIVGVGPVEGKLTLQGTGDFEGMKMFIDVWRIDELVNGFSGYILVPN